MVKIYHMKTFDKIVKNLLSPLDNEYVYTVVVMFLIVYSSVVAPKLPKFLGVLFESALFRMLMLFLIAFLASNNPTVALLSSLAFVLSIMALNRFDTLGGLVDTTVNTTVDTLGDVISTVGQSVGLQGAPEPDVLGVIETGDDMGSF